MWHREGAPSLGVRIGKRLAEGGFDGFFDLARRFIAPLRERHGIGPAGIQEVLLGEGEAVLAERGGAEGGINVLPVVVFAVADETEQRADDELRAAAVSGATDGFA